MSISEEYESIALIIGVITSDYINSFSISICILVNSG